MHLAAHGWVMVERNVQALQRLWYGNTKLYGDDRGSLCSAEPIFVVYNAGTAAESNMFLH